jgi:hypothetical protein
MGLISRLYNFVSGTVIDSEQVDAELNQIHAVLNGGIDSANVTDGSLALADLSTTTKNSFLKLSTVADRKEAFGVYGSGSVGSWGGTATVTGAIPHGLGTTPVNAQLTPTAGDTNAQNIAAMVISLDGTNINYRLISNGGNLSSPGVSIYWRAIA